MAKSENILKGLEKQVENSEIKIDDINRNLNQAKGEFKKPFIHDDIFHIIEYIGVYLDTVAQLMQPQHASASVCPKYHELMDIQSLEMYFRQK